MIKTSLSAEALQRATLPLKTANLSFAERYPGEPSGRQPIHTVYGGAHLFRADAAQKLGAAAIRAFEEYAEDPAILVPVLGLAGKDAPSSGEAPKATSGAPAEGSASGGDLKGAREDRATW